MKPNLALSIVVIAGCLCVGCSGSLAPAPVTVEAPEAAKAAVGVRGVAETPASQKPAEATVPDATLSGTKVPPDARRAVRLAVEELAKRLGVKTATIQLLAVEAVQWSDTSLGCPKENTAYAQVITPGFRVMLQARGVEYEYHTDEGRFVVSCKP